MDVRGSESSASDVEDDSQDLCQSISWSCNYTGLFILGMVSSKVGGGEYTRGQPEAAVGIRLEVE